MELSFAALSALQEMVKKTPIQVTGESIKDIDKILDEINAYVNQIKVKVEIKK